MSRFVSLVLISIILMSRCWAASLQRENDQYPAVIMTSGGSIYSYDQGSPPDIFFFPKDKARWDGTKVTLSEWYMLTDIQKERFINEYLGELKGAYKMDINTAGTDYLKAMNIFSAYTSEKTVREPSTKFIDILLSGQGKLNIKDRSKADAKGGDHLLREE